jgi:hypothetical protein
VSGHDDRPPRVKDSVVVHFAWRLQTTALLGPELDRDLQLWLRYSDTRHVSDFPAGPHFILRVSDRGQRTPVLKKMFWEVRDLPRIGVAMPSLRYF